MQSVFSPKTEGEFKRHSIAIMYIDAGDVANVEHTCDGLVRLLRLTARGEVLRMSERNGAQRVQAEVERNERTPGCRGER